MIRFVFLLLLALSSGAVAQTFEEYSHTVAAPYAGRYEARIGGSSEPAADRLRLDIGASIDILTIRDSSGIDGVVSQEKNRLSIGADFFTWSRLRSQDNFKFPVEAVDYYFGVNTGLRLARIAGHAPLISEIRLRVGHISAHSVDGDSTFGSASLAPITYSRELVDLMLAASGERIARLLGAHNASIRPYLGVLWIFHDVPAVASRATPYGGLDAYLVPLKSLPLVVKGAYEARLNTEIEPSLVEHHARLGLKIGRPHSNGVVLEASYFAGRSMYGQRFGDRESYASFGFAVEY